jgi:hypothetical protein
MTQCVQARVMPKGSELARPKTSDKNRITAWTEVELALRRLTITLLL